MFKKKKNVGRGWMFDQKNGSTTVKEMVQIFLDPGHAELHPMVFEVNLKSIN